MYYCTCGLEVKGGVMFYNSILDSYAIMINVVSEIYNQMIDLEALTVSTLLMTSIQILKK